jgi:hypothetical protein
LITRNCLHLRQQAFYSQSAHQLLSQQEEDTSQMDEAQVVECMALRFGAYSPAPMGRDHLDAQRGQRHVKPIRVVGTIPDQAPWEGIDEAGVKGWRDEGHLVRRI